MGEGFNNRHNNRVVELKKRLLRPGALQQHSTTCAKRSFTCTSNTRADDRTLRWLQDPNNFQELHELYNENEAFRINVDNLLTTFQQQQQEPPPARSALGRMMDAISDTIGNYFVLVEEKEQPPNTSSTPLTRERMEVLYKLFDEQQQQASSLPILDAEQQIYLLAIHQGLLDHFGFTLVYSSYYHQRSLEPLSMSSNKANLGHNQEQRRRKGSRSGWI
ncbi:hypothetical protein ACA910_018957 [Epithemia clementina (nom. ined.)]